MQARQQTALVERYDPRAVAALERVLAHFGRPTRRGRMVGGSTRLAERISERWPNERITPQAVRMWIVVPEARVAQVCAVSRGALRPAQVRPDLYPEVD